MVQSLRCLFIAAIGSGSILSAQNQNRKRRRTKRNPLENDHSPRDPVLSEATPKMATTATASRSLLRGARRFFSSSAVSHHNNHQQTHKFLEPNSFIGSWEAPKTPKEAELKLAMLRRQYAKQVKELRKDYIAEVEMMRIEKQRKDEARKEAIRAANEERRKLKAEAAKVRAQERQIALEEFRQTLLKERAEKLENWKMKETKREEKKKEKKELLRRQSSVWIDENQLETKILNALIETSPL